MCAAFNPCKYWQTYGILIQCSWRFKSKTPLPHTTKPKSYHTYCLIDEQKKKPESIREPVDLCNNVDRCPVKHLPGDEWQISVGQSLHTDTTAHTITQPILTFVISQSINLITLPMG